jgi:hypothetical protein
MTLGPIGSCHENAVQAYLQFHGIADRSDITLSLDFLSAIDAIASDDLDFVVQCSAHVNVHLATERNFREVPVVDTFIYPTKSLALVHRSGIPVPESLGLVPATAGYVTAELANYGKIIDMPSKPLVSQGLLAGDFDAGLTHLELVQAHPEDFVAVAVYGEVVTTWLVYGKVARHSGGILAQPLPGYFDKVRASAPDSRPVVKP